jgi:hypothetical protein
MEPSSDPQETTESVNDVTTGVYRTSRPGRRLPYSRTSTNADRPLSRCQTLNADSSTAVLQLAVSGYVVQNAPNNVPQQVAVSVEDVPNATRSSRTKSKSQLAPKSVPSSMPSSNDDDIERYQRAVKKLQNQARARNQALVDLHPIPKREAPPRIPAQSQREDDLGSSAQPTTAVQMTSHYSTHPRLSTGSEHCVQTLPSSVPALRVTAAGTPHHYLSSADQATCNNKLGKPTTPDGDRTSARHKQYLPRVDARAATIILALAKLPPLFTPTGSYVSAEAARLHFATRLELEVRQVQAGYHQRLQSEVLDWMEIMAQLQTRARLIVWPQSDHAQRQGELSASRTSLLRTPSALTASTSGANGESDHRAFKHTEQDQDAADNGSLTRQMQNTITRLTDELAELRKELVQERGSHAETIESAGREIDHARAVIAALSS